MNLARRYKLSKVGFCKLTESENTIINLVKGDKDNLSDIEKEMLNFVCKELSGLSEFTVKSKPYYVYYMNRKGECMAYYDKECGFLYIRYDDFWETLAKNYKLDHIIVGDIIKNIMELSTTITAPFIASELQNIESEYKSRK